MTLNEKTIFQITVYKDGHGLKTKVKKCLRPAFFNGSSREQLPGFIKKFVYIYGENKNIF